jgi:hypothetical protein
MRDMGAFKKNSKPKKLAEKLGGLTLYSEPASRTAS